MLIQIQTARILRSFLFCVDDEEEEKKNIGHHYTPLTTSENSCSCSTPLLQHPAQHPNNITREI